MEQEHFYMRWIAANAAGESLGLGTTFALGWLVAPHVAGDTEPRVILAGAAGAVLLGTLLEGVVVGVFQARALAGLLPGLRSGRWVAATALGACAAWLLGMIPSTLMSLAGGDAGGPPQAIEEPPVVLQLALAALMGSVLGPVLAAAQVFVLRRHVDRAGRWIGANALAWAAGMPVVFAGMDLLPWEGGGIALVVGLFAVALVAGAVVGAIHGRALLRMVPSDV